MSYKQAVQAGEGRRRQVKANRRAATHFTLPKIRVWVNPGDSACNACVDVEKRRSTARLRRARSEMGATRSDERG
jgi:hypothetical protein